MKKFILALAILASVISCNNKTSAQRVAESSAAVLVDDGVLSKAYTQAVSGYPVEIKTGDLKGDTLAQTEIFYDHAVITVDILRVDQAHDRLEPVIGHEMYHVVDARLKYGIDSFYQLVERDRNKDWHYRELEMSAIAQENSLRQRLLMQSKYKGMASTRDIQNRRAN